MVMVREPSLVSATFWVICGSPQNGALLEAVGAEPRGVPSAPGESVGTSVLHVLWGVRRRGHRLVQLLDAVDGVVDVGLYLDHAPCRRDLHHVVGEVGDGHELGQRRSAEDAVVRERRVGDVEDDLLGAEVLGVTESDRKNYPQRPCDVPVYTLEHASVLQVGKGDLQGGQDLCRQQVEARASVY